MDNGLKIECENCKYRYNEYKLIPCIECIYNPITHKKDYFISKNKTL